MKLNNKGFTLIELLAVVVVLLAISVIAIASISAAIERNKVKQNDAKKAIIVSAGEIYFSEHENSITGNSCIQLSDLVNAGLLTEDEIKDADDETFSGTVCRRNGIIGYED